MAFGFVPCRVDLPLSVEDLALAHRLATRRNEKEGVRGAMTYAGDDSFTIHYRGMLAEVAVARFFGVSVDESITPYRGKQGPDMVVKGYTVQVKATTLRPPLLLVEKHKPLSAMLYFCTAVSTVPPSVALCGYATRPEVRAKTPRRLKPTYPLNYIVEEHELRWFEAQKELAARSVETPEIVLDEHDMKLIDDLTEGVQ